LIKKVWAKFDGLDLKCVCDEHHRKCQEDSACKEYVVKFMEIERNQELDEAVKQIENEAKLIHNDIQKYQSKISRNLRKFKKYKI
jgi:hypothetical protein